MFLESVYILDFSAYIIYISLKKVMYVDQIQFTQVKIKIADVLKTTVI